MNMMKRAMRVILTQTNDYFGEFHVTIKKQIINT